MVKPWSGFLEISFLTYLFIQQHFIITKSQNHKKHYPYTNELSIFLARSQKLW